MTALREADLSTVQLPSIEPNILGLPIGEVRKFSDGKAQVYLGGNGVVDLTPHDTVDMREGAIHVEMFAIDGHDYIDYAEVTITPQAAHRTPTELGRIIRGLGTTCRQDYIERTPVQHFINRRGFMDIPISGRARWLALDPEGNFSEGIYDDRDSLGSNQVAMFGEGWTYTWIVQGSRPFKFGEICSPRFIDELENCPLGEDGITELDESDLIGEFAEKFALYTTGKHLRDTA